MAKKKPKNAPLGAGYAEAWQFVTLDGDEVTPIEARELLGPIVEAAEKVQRLIRDFFPRAGEPESAYRKELSPGRLLAYSLARKAVSELAQMLRRDWRSMFEPESRAVQHLSVSPEQNAAALELLEVSEVLEKWFLAHQTGTEMPEAPAGVQERLDCAVETLGSASETDEAKPPDVAHSEDFTSLKWGSVLYEFSPAQADVVKILYEHWERGAPTVSENYLIAELSDEDRQHARKTERIRDLFRDHKVWKKPRLIINGKPRGTYRLADPS